MEDSDDYKPGMFDRPETKKLLKYLGAGGLLIIVLYFIVTLVKGPDYPKKLYTDSVSVSQVLKNIKLDRPYYNEKVKRKSIQFYRENNHKTKWLEYKKPTRNYDAYSELIQEAASYGLNPDHYDFKEIDKSLDDLYDIEDRKPADVAALDVRITASFFLFTTHLVEGRIRTAGYGDYIWKKNVPKQNDVQLLQRYKSGKLVDIINALHPKHEQYEKLRAALKKYRKLENRATVELTGISKDVIKPGKQHPGIPEIRQKLFITDVKKYNPEDSLLYDERLVKGVKQFQKRHGLVADGIISDATMKYLRQSFRYKADLIELNLERIRWLPREIPEDYLTINIPEFILRVFQGGKKDMEMKVVLGSEYNATPIFSDTLEYIVFSPTWNVPASIMEEEFIPELQINSNAFDPERFVIYKGGKVIDPMDEDWNDEDLDPTLYKMVENPGERNSLGGVKFMAPNDFNIYLHDTPAENLFRKKKRAYSHGCIRVERPVDLASYLLKFNEGEEWSVQKILVEMKKDEPVTVNLKKKFPLQIDYRTVWVDEKGLLNFREDVYGHDRRQLALLNKIDEPR